MIAVDSSALVAVVLGEPEAEQMLAALEASAGIFCAANLVEAAIVVESRQGLDAARDLQLLIEGAIEEIVPVDADLADGAVRAWRRFGKGRHPAGLNFGDCFAYALAQQRGLPLLFKGDDFRRTDVGDALGS
ncbi:type II toxin-antitoxin system VapC family toxin [Parenemella sanctibonifatiensis]|uniref:type II toxin-antitoxin system VapC family toxin n=1 Tax=Parenemella sanctibonifatiensis TaxID=2016505 RepID=UPI001E5F098A|nr:type II toxin-antitoxin system VapC family toxin [Parenemella sanctibonifatiensis]